MNISWILTVNWCGFLELGVEKDQWNCPVTWPEAGWSVTPGSQGGRIVRPGDQRLLPLYVLNEDFVAYYSKEVTPLAFSLSPDPQRALSRSV